MKLKIRISMFLLSIVMVFSMFAVFPVFAAEGDSGYDTDAAALAADATFKFRKNMTDAEGTGAKYYTTLSAALASVGAEETAYIKMLDDVSVASAISADFIGVDVTLDLGGHTLTGPTNAQLLGNTTNGFKGTSLTFTNGTVEAHTLLYTHTASIVTFKDITVHVLASLYVACSGAANSTLVFDGATANIGGMTTSVSYDTSPGIESKVVGNLTIELKNDSTVTRTAQGRNKSNVPKALQNFLIGFNAATAMDLSIDGTSTLKMNITGEEPSGAIVQALIGAAGTYKNTASLNLTLAEGSTIGIVSKFALSSSMGNSYFVYQVNNHSIVDNGAIWQVSKEVLIEANKVRLPSWTKVTVPGKTKLGWSIGGRLVKEDALYYDTSVTDDILNFSFVAFDFSDFAMRNGASVRLTSQGGIRFETQVSTKLLALLGENVSFGTIISPTKFATNTDYCSEFTAETMAEADPPYYVTITRTKWAEQEETYKAFYGALEGIPVTTAGVDTALSARAYLIVTYSDSTTGKYYTAYSEENNSRSLRQVANAAYESGLTDNATVNAIRAIPQA